MGKVKVLAGAVVFGLLVIGGVGAMTMGVNDAGYRTVVQYPTGTVKIHFDPGWYLKWFGSSEIYPDAMTMDFNKLSAESGATINQPGIAVQYGDGGNGTVYGNARFNLPNDYDTMYTLHKEARSARGVAFKVLKPTVEEAADKTAGLMNSEDGYASKRAIFAQWTKQQITKGIFETESETVWEEDEATGKRVSRQVARIKMEGGSPIHMDSALGRYGITVATFQMNKPEFEPKTMAQIASKREATMAIITAKANAEKAKQDAITAEAQGEANVMTARYEKEVEKQRAVVEAEQKKEVAVIEAKRKVEVAEQSVLEATAYKNKQAELKAANILEGEGLAEKKRLLMEADGALEQKIDAVVEINKAYANAVGMQKWVPEFQMGSSSVSGDTSAATDLVQLLTAQAARAVNVDLSVK